MKVVGQRMLLDGLAEKLLNRFSSVDKSIGSNQGAAVAVSRLWMTNKVSSEGLQLHNVCVIYHENETQHMRCFPFLLSKCLSFVQPRFFSILQLCSPTEFLLLLLMKLHREHFNL